MPSLRSWKENKSGCCKRRSLTHVSGQLNSAKGCPDSSPWGNFSLRCLQNQCPAVKTRSNYLVVKGHMFGQARGILRGHPHTRLIFCWQILKIPSFLEYYCKYQGVYATLVISAMGYSVWGIFWQNVRCWTPVSCNNSYPSGDLFKLTFLFLYI